MRAASPARQGRNRAHLTVEAPRLRHGRIEVAIVVAPERIWSHPSVCLSEQFRLSARDLFVVHDTCMPAIRRVLVSQSVLNVSVDPVEWDYLIFEGDPGATVCL